MSELTNTEIIGGVLIFANTVWVVWLACITKYMAKTGELKATKENIEEISRLTQKGKNIATIDDIEVITKKVGAVKDEFEKLREERSFKNQLRLAALDKRLEAHQEAYSLWWDLMSISRDPSREAQSQVTLKCQSWWEQNCLFLTEEASVAFFGSYDALFMDSGFKDQYNKDPTDENKKEWRENTEKIKAAGEVIRTSLGLPPMIEAEKKRLPNSTELKSESGDE